MASTRRSRKRLRSPAGPLNSASIAGVIQVTRSHSSNASTLFAGAPLMRTFRPVSVSAAPIPVPMLHSPKEPCRPHGWRSCRRPLRAQPQRKPHGAAHAPASESDSASRRLVLPAPFSPVNTTAPGVRSIESEAIVSKIRKRKPTDMQGDLADCPVDLPFSVTAMQSRPADAPMESVLPLYLFV